MTYDPVRNRQDLDTLFGEMAQVGRMMKKKHADMMPFAMTMAPNGEVQMVASIGESSHELIENLRAGLTQGARQGQHKGVGLCYDTVLRDPAGGAQDALMFELEHQNDDAVRLVLPYKKGFFGGLKFGAPGRMPTEASFFRTAEADPSSDTADAIPPAIEAMPTKLIDSYCERTGPEGLSREAAELVAAEMVKSVAGAMGAASDRLAPMLGRPHGRILELLEERGYLKG